MLIVFIYYINLFNNTKIIKTFVIFLFKTFATPQIKVSQITML